MKFEKLWKLDSKGKLQEWEIESGAVREALADSPRGTITTRHGKVGGKIQENKEIVTEGKNLGRSNETTPVEQAEAEALSRWEKQVSRKGYTPDRAKAEAGGNDQAGVLSPMLAHKYSERAKDIVWPAYCQPKMDGTRLIAVYDGAETTLWSRERKPVVGLPHIAAAITAHMKELGITGEVIFDGEAYLHSYRDRFGEIVSFVKKLKPGHEIVQYHIYDIGRIEMDAPPTFEDRNVYINEILKNAPYCIQIVETIEVENEADATEAFKHFISLGYEGAMLRNSLSLYEEGKRSKHLQKMKEFDEEEFLILDVNEGRGKFAGLAVYVCRAANGKSFDCNPPGALAERGVEGCRKNIGKYLTVQFFGLTDAEQLPRFPVGKAVRDYE